MTTLSDRHWRVVSYLRFHLARRDHLPTTADLAEACRLRSTSSAHAILRDLEQHGLVVRASPGSPLARLEHAEPPVPHADDQTVWLLVRMLELQSTCELGWARDGLAVAADLDAMDWILKQAQTHLARLRSYRHVTDLLDRPTPATAAALEEIEVLMSKAARAYDPLKDDLRTWYTYSALGNAATARLSRNILERPELELLHLLVDTSTNVATRSDWKFCARSLGDGDQVVNGAALEIIDISNESTVGMRLLDQVMAEIVPSQAAFLEDLVGP